MTTSASVGGGPTYITTLVRHQMEKGRAVTIVCPEEEPYVTIWRDMGVSVYPVLERGVSLGSIIRLMQICAKFHGAIHAHGRGAAFYSLWPKLLLKKPVLFSPHGPHYIGEKGVRRIVAWSAEYVFRKLFDAAIYVSEGECETARINRLPLERSRVIRSGIVHQDQGLNGDAKKNREKVRHALGISAKHFVIGWIGRFHYQKGLDTLLASIPYVAHEVPEAVWIIVGTGDSGEAERYRWEVSNQGISERVYFWGEDSDASNLIHAFDMLISTSRWEGLPFVLLEALDQEKPVAATNVVGNRDVLGGWGMLFPPDDPRKAATAQIMLARRAEVRAELATKGKDILNTRFSSERMCEEFETVYCEVFCAATSR